MKTNRILIFAAIIIGLALLLSGHPLAGAVCLLAVSTSLSPQQARCNANALGTLSAAQVVVMEALALVFTKRPLLKNISTGFVDEDGMPYAKWLQTVYTRTKAVPGVQDATNNPTPTARADVDVPVQLNQYRTVWYQYLPTEYTATARDLIAESSEPLAVALGNDMVDAVAGVWTPANFPGRVAGSPAFGTPAANQKTVIGAGWDYTMITGLRSTLNKAGAPSGLPRFLVLNSDVYASLLDDGRIVFYLNNQANGEAIKTGNLPVVSGFAIDEYPQMPTNGCNLIGFCGSPDATVYTQRVVRDPREMAAFSGVPVPGLLTVVQEPLTGLSVNLDMWVDMGVNSNIAGPDANFRLRWMTGQAKGNANNGQLIVSQ